MEKQNNYLAPCQYCGAPTEFRKMGPNWKDPCQILNPDGSLHNCRERQRSQAIPHIFGTEVDNACAPLSPEEALDYLQQLYIWATELLTFEDSERYALNAAIEVMRLVTRGKVRS